MPRNSWPKSHGPGLAVRRDRPAGRLDGAGGQLGYHGFENCIVSDRQRAEYFIGDCRVVVRGAEFWYQSLARCVACLGDYDRSVGGGCEVFDGGPCWCVV